MSGKKTNLLSQPTKMTEIIHFAIPSYRRAETLKNKTIPTLRNIPDEFKTIFVADEEERKIYEKEFPTIKVVVGVLGISPQRNFIKSYYNVPNEYVVVMDDDIERFEKSMTTEDGKHKFEEIPATTEYFLKKFENAKSVGATLWGIYPARNAMFMERHKQVATTSFCFVIGCCYGFITQEKPILVSLESAGKEDYEQSLLHFLQDGKLLRFNKETIKTKFYAEGGLGKKEQRKAMNEKAATYLATRYPEAFKKYYRKDGTPEVRVNLRFQGVKGFEMMMKTLMS